MKKLILSVFLSLALLLSVNSVNAQVYALSVQGGYSWLSGVVGGDLQVGQLGVSAGWMPTKMPLSGEKLSSIGVAGTLYSGNYDESGYYVSLGVASNGYRYEYSSSWGANDSKTSPMTIAMLGYKYGSEDMNLKLGVGYGWCDYAKTWTWEITLGIPILKN